MMRLIPTYYFVLLSSWSLIYFLGSGPLLSNLNTLFYDCQNTWWASLTLISNLIPTTNIGLEGCMIWGSYVCLEIQLFMLLPVILLIHNYYPRIGSTILLSLFVGGTLICIYVIYFYEILPGYLFPMDY